MLLLWACLLSGVSYAEGAQSKRGLWVLREPGEIVEYDTSTWSVRNRKSSIKVAKESFVFVR